MSHLVQYTQTFISIKVIIFTHLIFLENYYYRLHFTSCFIDYYDIIDYSQAQWRKGTLAKKIEVKIRSIRFLISQ